MRNIYFDSSAYKDYVDWSNLNREVFNKINDLIFDITRDPFRGIGKPEPLKGNWTGYWSRRINSEHRLIYKVDNEKVSIVSCHGHY